MKLRIGESNTWKTDIWADGSLESVAVCAGFDHDKLADEIVRAVNAYPDLLAACRRAMDESDHLAVGTVEFIRAAIAKAVPQ